MRRNNLLTLILAFALFAVGCGGEDTTDSAGGGDGGPDAENVELDQDATFRYGYTVGPSRFDPHKASSSFDNASLFITYDRLVHQDPEGEAVPGLATEWELSEEALVLTLREGVTFHDGEPLNAEAVRANLERGQTVEGSTVQSQLAPIESIEVVDELTVRLNLVDGSGAGLVNTLSDRPGAMISPAAFDNPDLDLQPVGAGMFEVVEYQPDDLIVFERYDDYWDPEAVNVERFEFVIQIDSQTRLNAIQGGQLDATFVDPNQVPAAEQAGLNISEGSSLAFYHLQMNRARSEFGGPMVRTALNHAVDREAIVEGLLFGFGEPSVQPFPEGYFAANPDIDLGFYEHDPDLARDLLADAGLADGFSFETIVPTVPNIVQLAEAVQAQLAEVGVVMRIRQVSPVQTADIFYGQQSGDALVSPWGGRPDPSQTLGLLYSSEGFSNPGGATTDEIEAHISETRVPAERDERAEPIHEAVQAVTEEALDVVLYFPVTPTLTTDAVVGLESYLSGKPEFRGVGLRAS